MASLKLLFGMIPSTARIEQDEKALITEYGKLNSFSESEKLAEYNKLEILVNSSEFIQKRKDIESLKYKDSPEYNNEKEFNSLNKSRDIITYHKLNGSRELKEFLSLDGSEKIKEYENLGKEIASDVFKEKKRSKDFRKSEDFRKIHEYKILKNSAGIRNYYKFKKSAQYAQFLDVDGSQKLDRYNELKQYISSPEFIKRKEYLLDKKRFEKNEMYTQLKRFVTLKKDPDILWYFKVKNSDKFDLIKKRELTFSDEFEGEYLDTKKWLTNYYYGDKLLKSRYSVEPDLQAFTEKENFELRNSVLKIHTKPQKTSGISWTESKGFVKKDFDYTSGIINSGKSFRQKYGIFSAKIRIGNPGTKNAFWMLSDTITPHIDICRAASGKIRFDYFTGNGIKKTTSISSRYARDFFIYTLEWTPEKLVWKINDTVVLSQTENIPQEPMYILLSGGLDRPVNSMTSMEIDWIRVYQPK